MTLRKKIFNIQNKLAFQKMVHLEDINNSVDAILEVVRECVPEVKEFKGWQTAHSSEEFVERTEAYSWNECRNQILKNIGL